MLTGLRRRSFVVIAVVATAVLLVAVVVANTLIKHSAQQRIASLARCRLQAAGAVSAELPGTFAGLGAVFGGVGDVRVSADGVSRDGVAAHVDAVLHGVTTGGATSGGTAVATAPYGAMTKQLVQMSGLTAPSMTADGAGLVITGTRAGIPVTVHASIAVRPDGFTITPLTVRVLGRDLSVASLTSIPFVGDLAPQLGPKVFALLDLPDSAVLTAVRPDATGMTLDFSVPKRSASKAETQCAPTAG